MILGETDRRTYINIQKYQRFIHMYDFIIVIILQYPPLFYYIDCRKVETFYIKMNCQCITLLCAYLIKNFKVVKLTLRVCPLTITIYGIAIRKVADVHRKCPLRSYSHRTFDNSIDSGK